MAQLEDRAGVVDGDELSPPLNHFPLLSLLPELRTMIYEQLFCDLHKQAVNILQARLEYRKISYFDADTGRSVRVMDSHPDSRMMGWTLMFPATAISFTCRQLWDETKIYWRNGIRLGAFLVSHGRLHQDTKKVQEGKFQFQHDLVEYVDTRATLEGTRYSGVRSTEDFPHLGSPIRFFQFLAPVQHFEIGICDTEMLLKSEPEISSSSTEKLEFARRWLNLGISVMMNSLEKLPKKWRCSITTLTFHDANHELALHSNQRTFEGMTSHFPNLKEIRCVEAGKLVNCVPCPSRLEGPCSHRYRIAEGALYGWYSGDFVMDVAS